MTLKITVKPRLITFHKPREWSDIYSQILKECSMATNAELNWFIMSHPNAA
jgi:hypothetical protein